MNFFLVLKLTKKKVKQNSLRILIIKINIRINKVLIAKIKNIPRKSLKKIDIYTLAYLLRPIPSLDF